VEGKVGAGGRERSGKGKEREEEGMGEEKWKDIGEGNGEARGGKGACRKKRKGWRVTHVLCE